MASFDKREHYRQLSIVVFVVMLALLLPLTVFLARQEQTVRSQASQSNKQAVVAAPSPVTSPPFNGIFTCPGNPTCPSSGPSPKVSGGQPNPSVTVVVPSGTITHPSPSTAPCTASTASLAGNNGKSKHWSPGGGISGFIEALMKFFLELLNMILKLFGGGAINIPDLGKPNPNPNNPNMPSPGNPGNPGNPPPCAEPSHAPSQAQPSGAKPSISAPVPSNGTNPSVPAPSQPALTSPSGQAIPAGDLPNWKLIFADDFTKDASLGSLASDCGDGSQAAIEAGANKIVYTGATGTKWRSYPTCFEDTYQKRPYRADQVLSVKNGVLNFHLHKVDGKLAGANPSPVIVGDSQYQTYGRYVIRFKVDKAGLEPYYAVPLLWPANESEWQCAESDFPEGSLAGGIGGFHHYGCNGDQEHISGSGNFTEWHTFTQEWMPGSRKYYVDDKLIFTSNNQVYAKPERWQIQIETNGSDSFSGEGNLMVDWVAVYSYKS